VTTSGEGSAVYAVDIRTRTVTQVASLPAPVAHAPLVALGHRLLLVGGTDSSGAATRSILAIDPARGTVARAGTLPVPLADAAAVAVGRRAYVVGGGPAAVLELRMH